MTDLPNPSLCGLWTLRVQSSVNTKAATKSHATEKTLPASPLTCTGYTPRTSLGLWASMPPTGACTPSVLTSSAWGPRKSSGIEHRMGIGSRKAGKNDGQRLWVQIHMGWCTITFLSWFLFALPPTAGKFWGSPPLCCRPPDTCSSPRPPWSAASSKGRSSGSPRGRANIQPIGTEHC